MRTFLKIPTLATLIIVLMSFHACSSTNRLSIEHHEKTEKDQIVDQFEAKPLDSTVVKDQKSDNVKSPIDHLISNQTPAVHETPAPALKETPKKKKGSSKKLSLPPVNASATPVPIPTPTNASFVIPNRRPKEVPFWVGEVQTLDITYLGMVAGQFELELLPSVSLQNRKVYHFEGRAKSSSLFNLIYSLNDRVESFVDFEGLFSHKFHMVLDQTKQKRDSLELFDHEKKQEYYWSRKDHVTKGFSEIKEYQPIMPLTQDSFSAYHYLRTLPLETGKQYVIPVASEGRSWEAVATVVRREVISTSLGKKAAIVIKPQTRFQGVLKQGESDSFLWLSDDDRRFMLQFEAKVKIGSVIGAIKKINLGEKPTE